MQVKINGSGANQLTRPPYADIIAEESESLPTNVSAKGLTKTHTTNWAGPVKLMQGKILTTYLYALELLYIFYK